MKCLSHCKFPWKRPLITLAFAAVINGYAGMLNAEDVPAGFHRLANGKIMADEPATAVAPAGYYLRKNGILIKVSDDIDLTAPPLDIPLQAGEVPPGFYKMVDGRLMANDPDNAVAPAGYHMMPDGTLMSNSGEGGGGHHHGAGMWMFDYKYVRMYMKDLLDTTRTVTPQQAVAVGGKYGYMMSPVDMTMHMHMLMMMYGITDKVMPMIMLHYMKNDMTMYSVDGTESTMHSSGIADTVISAMIQGPYHTNFNIGLSLPTGSINERGPMTHTAGNVREEKYPYGMQLGSGSYELKQGISYEDATQKIGWGASYEYTARLNTNDNDYKLGNFLLADSWLRWNINRFVSVTSKMQLRSQSQMVGADPALDRTMSPAANASAYGGQRVDASAIIKFSVPSPMLSVTLDFTQPVYQNLWGLQMATSWIASINVGLMIH